MPDDADVPDPRDCSSPAAELVDRSQRPGSGKPVSGLGRYKDAAETIQAAATVLALLIAGAWTYILFVQNRERSPKASVEHSLQSVPLTNDLMLLRTSAKVTNVGKVLLSVGKTTVWVQQIVPLADCGDKAHCPSTLIISGVSPRMEGEPRARWPLLDSWSGQTDFELEPGESETLAFDFEVPASVQIVQIYTYLENLTKKEKGWKNYSIHTLSPSNPSQIVETSNGANPPAGEKHATSP